MVDRDPSGVIDKLSWLRRCGEAHGACFFNSIKVINGYVLGVVFLGVPEPDFLSLVSSWVVIMQLTFLIEKLPLLKPQYVWLQQPQNFPSVTMSKHEDVLPFASSFNPFLCLR